MKPKITIVDCESGNLRSVAKAFEHAGATVELTRDAALVQKAHKLVLPGQGAFKHCIEALHKHALTAAIQSHLQQNKPFFGICVGMQLLFESSEENPGAAGLGFFKGTVKRFDNSKNPELKIPHMGWNAIMPNSGKAFPAKSLLQGIEAGADYYFVHSYYVCPQDTQIVAAQTQYGLNFCAAIEQGHVFACQFHPEKSGLNGIHLIRNFCAI